MTKEQALEKALIALDVERGPGYQGRLWNSVAAALLEAQEAILIDVKLLMKGMAGIDGRAAFYEARTKLQSDIRAQAEELRSKP